MFKSSNIKNVLIAYNIVQQLPQVSFWFSPVVLPNQLGDISVQQFHCGEDQQLQTEESFVL
ncbi:hypothetical protein Hanom_Chr14g01269121 [Helianthus anomalus]